MRRIIRDCNPLKYNLSLNRTDGAQLFLRPDPVVNEIIGGVVAKYQEKHEILIYTYQFLSNHYHIQARAPQGNLWKFKQDVNREIAKRVNRLRGRRGHFWEGRYKTLIVVDEVSDNIKALLYVVTNPTHHGLVAHPKNWPGVNCYWHLLDGKDRVFRFTNWTEYHRAKRRARFAEVVHIREFQTIHKLRLTPLPCLARMDKKKRGEYLSLKIESKVEEIREERAVRGEGFLGRKKILEQSPSDEPKSVKRSSRPSCYTSSPQAKRSFEEEERGRIAWYHDSSKKFRGGDYQIIFPPWTFRPRAVFPEVAIGV